MILECFYNVDRCRDVYMGAKGEMRLGGLGLALVMVSCTVTFDEELLKTRRDGSGDFVQIADTSFGPDATRLLGTPCSSGGQCASGFCVDNVCCDKACQDTCQVCNKAGDEGQCKASASGTACGSVSCVSEDRLSAKLCDDKGKCESKETACESYKCDSTAGACFASCSSDAQCYRYKCDTANSTCLTACKSASDCQSGFDCSKSKCK
jgi:hypothetical protein